MGVASALKGSVAVICVDTVNQFLSLNVELCNEGKIRVTSVNSFVPRQGYS